MWAVWRGAGGVEGPHSPCQTLTSTSTGLLTSPYNYTHTYTWHPQQLHHRPGPLSRAFVMQLLAFNPTLFTPHCPCPLARRQTKVPAAAAPSSLVMPLLATPHTLHTSTLHCPGPLACLQAIQGARSSCAIVLTTHYMEEAEGLCDRLGVFVGGRLRCIGSPKV